MLCFFAIKHSILTKFSSTKESLKLLCEKVSDVAMENGTKLSIGNEKLGIPTCLR